MVTASFLAVVFVVMEYKAATTLTLVAAEGVDTVLLAAAVILGALVLVWQASLGGPVSFLYSEFELVGSSPRGLQSWPLF